MSNQVIPEAAVEAAQKVAFERYGSRPDAAYLRTILKAAAPHMLAHAKAEAWEHCAKKAEAATKLAAPDHITPMGACVIRESIKDNPYRPTP